MQKTSNIVINLPWLKPGRKSMKGYSRTTGITTAHIAQLGADIAKLNHDILELAPKVASAKAAMENHSNNIEGCVGGNNPHCGHPGAANCRPDNYNVALCNQEIITLQGQLTNLVNKYNTLKNELSGMIESRDRQQNQFDASRANLTPQEREDLQAEIDSKVASTTFKKAMTYIGIAGGVAALSFGIWWMVKRLRKKAA